MFENYLVTFGLTGFAGLLIMILGLRSAARLKATLLTVGTVVLHVGVFGILYQTVDRTLFTSLVALVLSIFILIDPLKLTIYIDPKAYRATGLLLLFAAIAFSTMFFTNFPVWLWTVPLLVYLLPYVLPPLKERIRSCHFLAWFLVFIYMALISCAMYGRVNPGQRFAFLTDWFARPWHDAHDIESLPSDSLVTGEPQDEILPFHLESGLLPHGAPTNPDPTEELAAPSLPHDFHSFELKEEGPFLRSLKNADKKFLRLQRDYETLKQKYQDLEDENSKLRDELRKPGKTGTTEEL